MSKIISIILLFCSVSVFAQSEVESIYLYKFIHKSKKHSLSHRSKVKRCNNLYPTKKYKYSTILYKDSIFIESYVIKGKLLIDTTITNFGTWTYKEDTLYFNNFNNEQDLIYISGYLTDNYFSFLEIAFKPIKKSKKLKTELLEYSKLVNTDRYKFECVEERRLHLQNRY